MKLREGSLWALSFAEVLSLLSACRPRRTPILNALNTTSLDLIAGWRLRVAAPVLEDLKEPLAISLKPDGPLGFHVTAAPNLSGFKTQ
jgi:hypothetical protein